MRDRRGVVVGVVGVAALVAMGVGIWSGRSQDAEPGGPGRIHSAGGDGRQGRPEITERWGVSELRVRRSAAGHLLDFRYRVVDPVKAARLHSRDARPFLLDERSGRKLAVPTTPKAGSLRNTAPPKQGRIYFALFSNPGGAVKRGDQVSVVIDSFRASSLVVE